MKSVIIDGEQITLEEITGFLRKYNEDILGVFTSQDEGYDFVMRHQPDVVFLSIDRPPLEGLKLGLKIRTSLPKISIVYVSPHPQYALESFQSFPVDYLLKPVDERRLAGTIEHIRRNISAGTENTAVPRIQCFGKFRVTMGEEELKFSTQKVREMLAFLMCYCDRPVFRNDMVRSLFSSGDEKKDANNFRVTLYRLRHTLMESRIQKNHLLIREDCSVDVAPGVCDLTDLLKFVERHKIIDEGNCEEAQRIIDSVRGDLFGDLDTLWVTDMREYVNVLIEDMILKTAQFYMLANKNAKKAESILMKLIELNDLSEQGYITLLELYIRIGDHDKYIRMYRRYARVLKIDLDSKPERKYTEYYIKCN